SYHIWLQLLPYSHTMLILLCYLSSFYFPCFFFFYGYGPHRDLHSFPTRRSSDLTETGLVCRARLRGWGAGGGGMADALVSQLVADRKSTRLNSSHGSISYAVFCLKKKKKKKAKQHERLNTESSRQ